MWAIWGPYGGGYCAFMARPSERSRLRYTICYLPACALVRVLEPASHPHMAAYGPHMAPIWPTITSNSYMSDVSYIY